MHGCEEMWVYVITAATEYKAMFYIMTCMDACPLNRDLVRSLDFAVDSCFREIFFVRSQNMIEECKTLFNCLSIFETMITRKLNFYISIFTWIMK